jgi:hypothetical protein
MKDFLSDVVAAMLAIMILAIGFAYFTADPLVKTWCDVSTSNPFDQTSCIVTKTLKS